ncbi:PH domain-containing protein [Streptomyces turgidiscabies]|uniref:Peptidoglycan/LPS O-acetylase OafA/YrhL n=1 Tax=Streptomyces turgidiscabies TaxID=85558 RepID=A0ABU0RNV9_9ACTN|nr:PH domain-containing protein [Streptomyces turgidiscabies]MDQ0933672.1 peptidoglycan/LPS O-acetylase OafA/YrhL [Streptomyces turgidiscabies]
MGGDTGGIERVYRGRGRRRLPWLNLGLTGVISVNALLQAGHFDDPYAYRDGPPGWLPLAVGLLMAASFVRLALEQLRAHTRVTATGITVQGGLGSRSWAWHKVYDIRVERAPRGNSPMGPQWLTYLYDVEGRRHLLWHLDDWQLDDAYAEVSELCLSAAPYRSLTWEPRPQVEARILRGAARRKAWTWAAYSALAVLIATFVVGIWAVIDGRPEHPFLLLVCVPLASFAVLGAVLHRYWTSHPPRSLAQQP